MKIEMGESLLQSYLKHVEQCMVTQTNWKASASWQIAEEDMQKAGKLFERIKSHPGFGGVFGSSSLTQALKQAELDVIGIRNDKLYMVEVAFHENGLQYGDKEETRDRVSKKLLRAYLVGLACFPNFEYEIVFASPRVHRATDDLIRSCMEELRKDFVEGGDVAFRYLANAAFQNEVLLPTLKAMDQDADTSELFLRSAKMLRLFGVLDKPADGQKPAVQSAPDAPADAEYDLMRDLRTVGLSTFVRYYGQFADPACGTADIKAQLIDSGLYKLNSCATKASVGKRIIRNGAGWAALEIISRASNIDDDLRKKTLELLGHE